MEKIFQYLSNVEQLITLKATYLPTLQKNVGISASTQSNKVQKLFKKDYTKYKSLLMYNLILRFCYPCVMKSHECAVSGDWLHHLNA